MFSAICMAATTPTLFQDFDDQGVFRRFRTLAESHETLNFVVDFNEEKAQCAFDLSAANVKQVLDDKVSSDAAHRHEVSALATRRIPGTDISCSHIARLVRGGCKTPLDVRIPRMLICKEISGGRRSKKMSSK